MIVFDHLSLAFIRKTEEMLREILREIGVTVRRSRFEMNRYLYPIHVVVFEGPEFGHFNAPYLQIGLNRKLIYSAKDSVIRDILRHELAHYITYILHGSVQAHGSEFNNICSKYGFPANVAEATLNLDLSNQSKEGDLASEKVIEKVKKLLQLAESSNVHEAELATCKANQLLLRHNIDTLSIEAQKNQDSPLYMDRLVYQTRKDGKLLAIYEILRHFIVRPVFSYGKNSCCLEVSGTLTNVRLARYVFEFLNRELDFMWEQARVEHKLSGLRAKNSFFAGVAQGFDQKMKTVKQGFSGDDQKSLLVVEKQLQINVSQIYRRLSSSHSGAVTDGEARGVGIEKGKKLSIRQGVETRSSNLFLPS